MLPPINKYAAYLRQRLQELQHAAQEPPQADTVKSASRDMTCLLHEFFYGLSPAERDRRWRVTELRDILHGRYRRKFSAMQIAAALRTLGFTEHRDWTKAGRNRRFWLPTNYQLKGYQQWQQ